MFRRPIVSVLSLVLLTLSVNPANADPFGTGGPDTGDLADSVIHTYCYSSAYEAQDRDNSEYAFWTSLDAATDMIARNDTGSTNCTTDADVCVQDGNLPAGVRGSHICISYASAHVCNHSEVTVDPAEIFIGANDEEDLTKTLCHEIGHSVGLTHGGLTDCMRNGEIPDPGVVWRSYDAHHKGHINAAY